MYATRLGKLGNVWWLAGLLSLFGAGWPGTAFAGNIIVDTEYVLKNKDKPGVILLDARAERDYKKGVIHGASVIGAKGAAVELRDMDARILPAAKLEKILGEAGIAQSNEIIVYGDKGDNGPYVAFWVLDHLGADKAKVYHGGIDDWTTAKNPITNEVKKLPAATFTAKVQADRLATTEYVQKNLKNKDVQFIDSRTRKENSGDDIRALRGGYIPAVNHVNIPHEEGWKDPDTLKKLADKQVENRHGAALKDPAELKALYKNLDPNKEVVAYCQTGTRSTQTYAVLRDMGFKKVRNYDDSWIVWGSNLDLPTANTSYFDFVKVNAAMKRVDDLEKKVEALIAKK